MNTIENIIIIIVIVLLGRFICKKIQGKDGFKIMMWLIFFGNILVLLKI